MTARQLLEEGIITDQQVADVPDFATLFTDGIYGRILEDAGYGRQLDVVRGFDEGVGVSVEARPVYSAEGVKADPNFIRRELGDFADRLEVLARDGKQALRKFSVTVPQKSKVEDERQSTPESVQDLMAAFSISREEAEQLMDIT